MFLEVVRKNPDLLTFFIWTVRISISYIRKDIAVTARNTAGSAISFNESSGPLYDPYKGHRWAGRRNNIHRQDTQGREAGGTDGQDNWLGRGELTAIHSAF